MTAPLVIIGNGMAAARLVEELASRTVGRHAITIVGEEPHAAYNRILLSAVLAGEQAPSDISLKPTAWWRDHGIHVLAGRRVTAIERDDGQVRLDDGRALPYSNLVLATGSVPIRLPLPGIDLPGVFTFRGLADVAEIKAHGGVGKKAVVIGGGLLGLEAAYGLARGGAAVTVVHLMDRLMERQLDAEAAAMLKRAVTAKGIAVRLGADTAAILGKAAVEGVAFRDGTTIAADLVVIAVGIRPNVALAREAGMSVNRGVCVDDGLATDAAGIYAIGECAEHRGVCSGLVEPAYAQARILAERLAGGDAVYTPTAPATHLKVSGVGVFSAGDFEGGENSETITFRDPARQVYRKLVVRDGCLAGAVLFGDTSDAPWYLDLMRAGTAIEQFRDALVFGRSLALKAAA
jgi:nitrite reductase (NADH) large subunit